MVPYNKNYDPRQEASDVVKLVERTLVLKAPTIDQSTGLCIVCGMGRKDGHGWPCITYLMKLAVSSYEKKMQKAEFVLKKILNSTNVGAEEIEHVLEEIQGARDLINGIAENSQADHADYPPES